jgi:hypothetical protein
MQSVKERAIEVFNENLDMIPVDQTQFRRKVMQTLVIEFSITNATAATHYNNAKKLAEKNGTVFGLGRQSVQSNTNNNALVSDSELYTIVEVINGEVARTQSFLNEKDARAKLAIRKMARIPTEWKLIKGIGPNVGDTYKLTDYEAELA